MAPDSAKLWVSRFWRRFWRLAAVQELQGPGELARFGKLMSFAGHYDKFDVFDAQIPVFCKYFSRQRPIEIVRSCYKHVAVTLDRIDIYRCCFFVP